MSTPPLSASTTVAEYLLQRLVFLGVRHVFGVPGDYNLALLDIVLAHPDIDWVGTAGELGAAYAADGYARTAGFGALLTTFGVGELSAINGVAGSYAERVPLVHLAVGPAEAAERAGAVMHHTAGDGDYERFARAHGPVTCAQAVLRPTTAATEIDRVLTTAIRESRPGYLRLPSDVASALVEPPTERLALSAGVDEDSFAAFLDVAGERLAEARTVTVLADFLVDRFHARAELIRLLEAGRFPWATLSMGKTVVGEGNPQFLGVYSGAFSDERTRTAVDEADLLIRAGVLLADTTSGGFTQGFDRNTGIELEPHSAMVDGKRFEGVPLAAALAGLTGLVEDLPAPAVVDAIPLRSGRVPHGDGPLTQDHLWDAVAEWMPTATTVLAEQGTSFFGLSTRRLPTGVRFLAQPLWGSVGYTLPALLGAQLADPARRGLLLIGDGSAQMTVQELGTIARQGLTPVILLVNNDGYTVERAIHGPRAEYNDIAMWDWSAVPAALGAPESLVLEARTPAELAAALELAEENPDRLVFIQAFTDIDDVPDLLRQLAEGVRLRNGGPA
ncbi:thiamine pyrophosphate-dependent enzyme [Saccharopolyspora sp. K220]|uniref:alpha-keto acid decarboxylase family protein n=1 Tax=Saccharopolyspora soli TaxID=2926618 RepID=UPI001F5616E7|nr:thiamine pyrophosphate-binding protein [Saccharopolyspora soli]MCI2420113.1 thiamine pyrophosphate-dependent enzyme [Saccharopolyspora soli]